MADLEEKQTQHDSVEDVKLDKADAPDSFGKLASRDAEERGLSIVLKNGLRLHPQPTSDPLDPLNWSKAQKNVMLAIVMALYGISEHKPSK